MQRPTVAEQSGSWATTGAEGCDGLVPAQTVRRLSWSTPNGACWAESTDGEGNLAAGFADDATGTVHALVFLPSDADSGVLSVFDRNIFLTPRKAGFYLEQEEAGIRYWLGPIAPDGTAEGSPTFVESWWNVLLSDPRGGYVDQRDRLAPDSTGWPTHYVELRWLDEALNARTDWIPVTSWPSYPPGDGAGALIDVTGNALVLHDFNARLPCPGTHRVDAFWVSDDGTLSAFSPLLPEIASTTGCPPNISWSGPALPLDEGGFALFEATSPNSTVSPTGWFARYSSGSTANSAPPSWLSSHDGSIERLDNGAYFATRRDPTTCGRTVEIIGPAGQLCATLALDGSTDCALRDHLFADGTLALEVQTTPCSLTWWPGLARAR